MKKKSKTSKAPSEKYDMKSYLQWLEVEQIEAENRQKIEGGHYCQGQLTALNHIINQFKQNIEQKTDYIEFYGL